MAHTMRTFSLFRFICFLLLGSALFASCATYRLDPVAGNGVSVRQERNVRYAIWSDESTELRISTDYTESAMAISVYIANLGEAPVFVADSDFSVFISEDGVEWESHPIWDSQGYYDKVYTDYVVSAVLLGISAGLNAASAGRGSWNSTSYGSDGSVYRTSGTYYSPGAASAQMYASQQNLSRFANNATSYLKFLEANLFYAVDLQPQHDYAGYVFSKLTRADWYKVVFDYRGEKLEFVFNRHKVSSEPRN